MAVIIPATTIEACMKDIPLPITIYDVPTGVFEDGEEVMAPRVHIFEHAIVDVADIPSDRTFRGAWTWAS